MAEEAIEEDSAVVVEAAVEDSVVAVEAIEEDSAVVVEAAAAVEASVVAVVTKIISKSSKSLLGGGRGGGRGGMRGGIKVMVEPHKFPGIFIARSKEDALVTKSLTPGESVYNEKRITVPDENGEKVEYRVWNAYRSKLAATVLGGVDNFNICPGARVLYLGAASGTTVSHVADIVGPVIFHKSIYTNAILGRYCICS